MKTPSTLCSLALCCTLTSAAWADNTANWSNASSILAAGLPTLAGAWVLQQGDAEGARQLALSLGSSLAAAEVLKQSVHATRPDGSDKRSFPSAHTAVAFSAVAFMDRRYGEHGARFTPLLYGAAALTGLARVQAQKHHWGDVLAGGVLGIGAARLWTESVTGGQMSVWPATGGLTVAWAGRF